MASPSRPDLSAAAPAGSASPSDPAAADEAEGGLSRRALLGLGGVVLGLAGSWVAYQRFSRFPPDTTPEGAYLRVAVAVSDGRARDCFAYLEDQAQHACYSILGYRKRASERVAAAYPEPERSRLLEAYRKHANAADGADVWLDMAERRGFIGRLRRDLSGVGKVETSGERATIETARGTRYGFRKRPNGIWGLTLFTAELLAEAERAARDADVVEKAAGDYERARDK
ncbi:Hypothetical protein A7982_11349 [Minicystis rosea]|nr:Hypothetical protein A7982_11349 [Minicystis rosea]